MPIDSILLILTSGLVAGFLLRQLMSMMPFGSFKNHIINHVQMKAIKQATTDGFVIIDRYGQIIYANQALLDLFGYHNAAQLVGLGIDTLISPSASHSYGQYLQQYLKTGKSDFIGVQKQLKTHRHDGSGIDISLSINLIHLDNNFYPGKRFYFSAFIRNIGAAIEIYRQIEYQRNKFETLFEYSPDGMLYIDNEMKVLDANRQFLRLSGLEASDLGGTELYSLFTTDTPQLTYIKALLSNIGEEWGKNEVLASLNSPLSKAVTVLISSQIIPSANNEHHIYVFRDISKELELIAHIVEKNQTLELSEALVNMGYWRYDVKKRQLWCSRQLFKILNIPPTDDNHIDVKRLYPFIQPQDKQHVTHTIQQCFNDLLPLSLSLSITLEDKAQRYILLKGINETASGRLTTIYGLAQDVTEQHRQEENLRLTKERLEHSQTFSNIGNWEWNIDTGQVYWSELVTPMFGGTQQSQLTNFNYYVSTIHPDDRESVSAAIALCIDHTEKYDIEHRVIWPDHSIHWLHQQGDVLRDADNHAISMIGVVQDITGRKAREAQLHLFKQIIESSSQAIRVSTHDGLLVYCNRAHQKLFLHGPDIQQYMVTDFLSPAFEHSGVAEKIKQSMTRHNHWSGQLESQRCDGSQFPAHVSLSQFNDRRNKLQYRFSFSYDSTDEITQQEKLQQAKQAAESANRAKSEFLSSMSHELRTPLNAVLGFSQLLLRQKELQFSERIQGNIEAIYKAGEHLLTLINGILDLATVESGKLTPDLVPVNISEVIDEAVHLILPRAEAQNLSLQTAGGGKIPTIFNQQQIPVVNADFTVLKQALLNYLSNAVKYSKEDGIIFIIVDIDPGQKTMRISVCDNGIGIAAESIADLFTPFNRLGLEASNIQGTGIGLAITKKNIESLLGSVGVYSKLGGGSDFWIELPYIELLDASPIPLIQAPNARFTVLYIEDNPSNTKLMKSYFDDMMEATLITAANAELGIALASDYLPAIVLLDLNLPGIDGFVALQKMKKMKILQHTVFIAVTANAMSKTRAEVMKSGFDDFLSKPIDLLQLQHQLQQYSHRSLRETPAAITPWQSPHNRTVN